MRKKIHDEKGKLFCLRCTAESNYYDASFFYHSVLKEND